jgi:hypothetical protein
MIDAHRMDETNRRRPTQDPDAPPDEREPIGAVAGPAGVVLQPPTDEPLSAEDAMGDDEPGEPAD